MSGYKEDFDIIRDLLRMKFINCIITEEITEKEQSILRIERLIFGRGIGL